MPVTATIEDVEVPNLIRATIEDVTDEVWSQQATEETAPS